MSVVQEPSRRPLATRGRLPKKNDPAKEARIPSKGAGFACSASGNDEEIGAFPKRHYNPQTWDNAPDCLISFGTGEAPIRPASIVWLVDENEENRRRRATIHEERKTPFHILIFLILRLRYRNLFFFGAAVMGGVEGWLGCGIDFSLERRKGIEAVLLRAGLYCVPLAHGKIILSYTDWWKAAGGK